MHPSSRHRQRFVVGTLAEEIIEVLQRVVALGTITKSVLPSRAELLNRSPKPGAATVRSIAKAFPHGACDMCRVVVHVLNGRQLHGDLS